MSILPEDNHFRDCITQSEVLSKLLFAVGGNNKELYLEALAKLGEIKHEFADKAVVDELKQLLQGYMLNNLTPSVLHQSDAQRLVKSIQDKIIELESINTPPKR